MAELTKGKFITDILATSKNIAAWKAFRTGTTELSIAVNEAWESSQGVVLTSPFVQGLIGALVPAVLDQAALDRFNAEIEKQKAFAEAISTAVHEVYAIGTGFGYRVKTAIDGAIFVVQPHLPASAGSDPMTNDQAELLGWLVAEKIRRGMNKSISIAQQIAALTKTKTLQQIIDEEIAIA